MRNLTERTSEYMVHPSERSTEPAPNRSEVIDHNREVGESSKRSLESMNCGSPNGPIRRKPRKNRPIQVVHSTELAGIFKGLGEGWKTAKPLCVGSIPTCASKSSQQLSNDLNQGLPPP